MLFTIRRPKSERFFQLSFEGFKPRGRNKIEELLKILIAFLKAIRKYLYKKIRFLGRSVLKLFIFGRLTAMEIKSYIVRKLIWSRGRLSRPISTVFIMSGAFFVFIFGEVFNSSRFVNSQEINPDYLQNVTDIIPQKNTATTLLPENRQRTEPIPYVVEEGDTLSGIGEKFKISVDALTYVNNINDRTALKVGQQIIIPPVSGLIHKVARGDNLTSIAQKYSVPAQSIADFNYILDTSRLAVGTELIIPGAKVPDPVIVLPPSITPPAPNIDPNVSKGWCMWPTTSRIITQYFSWYHNGLDIATPWGGAMPPLYACAGGTVVRAGWDPFGLGLHVQIDHGNGYQTVYGHMSRIDVGYGAQVSKGTTIGLMGNTGRSTGPHVHFIIKYNGVAQNPLNYIQ